jgi:small subunit ribosomal protein S21
LKAFLKTRQWGSLLSCLEKAPHLFHGGAFLFLDFLDFMEMRGGNQMKVVVQNNQIEKAIKDLKRKLTKEGFFSEIKERRFYDKPSVQKKKKQAKAAKRRRKRMRRF